MDAFEVYIRVYGGILSQCSITESGELVVSQIYVLKDRVCDFIFEFLRVFLEHANTRGYTPGTKRWENTLLRVTSGTWTDAENTRLDVFGKFAWLDEPVLIGKIECRLGEVSWRVNFGNSIYAGNLGCYDYEMKKIR